MEHETSSLVSLGIVLIAVAVVITLGFGIFAVGKRLANSGQNDVVAQVDQINNSTFTDLDQQVITGTRLKGVISQLSTGNYAVLLNTLALRNCYSSVSKASVSGDLMTGASQYKDYIVKTNLPSIDSKGNKMSSCWFINYNAILGDAGKNISWELKDNTNKIKDDLYETAGSTYVTLGDTDKASGKYLWMQDGIFTTEYEFKTESAGNVLKNNRASDFTKQGTTMYIADGAQFNSYVIKDSTDNYVGLAFVQIQK